MRLIILILLSASNVFASMIRSVDSSARDYTDKAKETYVQFQLKNLDAIKTTATLGLDEALQALYENAPNASELTQTAIKNVQANVLNTESKQVLLFLLRRSFEKFNDRYSLLRMQSLVRNEPTLLDLIEDDRLKSIITKTDSPPVLGLTNFITALKQRSDLAGSQFLIDGKAIELNPSFKVPRGVYQWTILSNVYSQYIFVGSWEEFTVKIMSRSGLIPLVEGDCINFKISPQMLDAEAQVFFSRKCILDSSSSPHFYSMGTNGKIENRNEVALPTLPEIRKEKGSWFLPALAVIAAGVAYSLKDKHVAMKAPSFRF